ncbi:MAG: GNAT family N-acetyltransferase [Patescibacteria group bacterium]|nr:GNAT family N-acetyltransferase [Patescibacteria group bacterium]
MKKKTETPVFLRGRKTILRPLSESDLPLCQKWINDPEVRVFIKNIFPMTMGAEREWLESRSKKNDKDIILIIEVKGRPIGSMGIHGIDWKDRTATTGALIGEKQYWGKGYGTDAKMALLDYAFNTLNLRKIMSRVIAFNARSLAYSLHCGYKVEGRLRRQHFVGGRYWDEIILGLFRSDWLKCWEKWRKG